MIGNFASSCVLLAAQISILILIMAKTSKRSLCLSPVKIFQKCRMMKEKQWPTQQKQYMSRAKRFKCLGTSPEKKSFHKNLIDEVFSGTYTSPAASKSLASFFFRESDAGGPDVTYRMSICPVPREPPAGLGLSRASFH